VSRHSHATSTESARRHELETSIIELIETKMVLESGAAFLMFVYVWWWLVNRMSHHDDDEVYTAFFRPSASPVATPHAFAKILGRMPEGSHVLDIGIGSGVYLEHPPVQEILRSRKIKVDGVDIAEPSIAICNDRIRKHKLEAHVTAHVLRHAFAEQAEDLGAERAQGFLIFNGGDCGNKLETVAHGGLGGELGGEAGEGFLLESL
jgi:2-polyprenyl-3-methyl-5-hydroxy-6-metoxy-1,4-benzoquinol methylase